MSRRELLGSTPFRLTLKLVAIFSLAMLVTFASAYLLIRGYLEAELRDELGRELAVWQAANLAPDLERHVAEAVARTDPAEQLIALVTADGRRIGNVPNLGPVDGVRVLDAGEIPITGADLSESYLVATVDVAGGKLLLGASREKVAELGEFFALIFLIAVLPTISFASVLGLATAQTTRQRIEQLRRTLAAMTGGELGARVPENPERADDLDQIGQAINRLAAAQAASIESLRQVSADIAHDLKTPIQRVAVLLDRLQAAGPLAPSQEQALEAARGETRQIVQTFEALLQIAQVEGGGAQARFAPIDLAATVASVAEVYAPAAEETGHSLHWRVPAAPVAVWGERHLLGQLLANLIENALRHAPAGCRIDVELSADGTLAVSDDGPGIPEDERQNVLRRLYRLERSRTTDGSGLGLSLVAAVAGVHDAVLTLEDAGPGLRVIVRFPPKLA